MVTLMFKKRMFWVSRCVPDIVDCSIVVEKLHRDFICKKKKKTINVDDENSLKPIN